MPNISTKLLALPAAVGLSLSAAAATAATQYEVAIYSPLSVNEVVRDEGCEEVVAAGKRVDATCSDNGRFAVEVDVRQVEGGRVRCIVSLAPGEDEPKVGHDRDDYGSREEFERCENLVSVAPGEKVMGRHVYHVTKSAW